MENVYFYPVIQNVSMPKKKRSESEILTDTVVKGLIDKKGNDILSLKLADLSNSVSDYFVICHGTSRTHVEALADSVERQVKTKLGFKPWHREGLENAEWILLDYVDVVVHIFQEETRKFYNLEKLWADAEIRTYAET